MHAKTILTKLAAPCLAAMLLMTAGPTIAAPQGAGATQQQPDKPDCKKNPDDVRCPKK